uniref:Uncharacterized protein n=1 Tax=Alexandrium catenella TaxID=2925 RepID=A0A7S1RVM5_ALECA
MAQAILAQAAFPWLAFVLSHLLPEACLVYSMSSALMNADDETRQGNDKLKAKDFTGARVHFEAAVRLVKNVDPEKEATSASEEYGLEEGKRQRLEELGEALKKLDEAEKAK